MVFSILVCSLTQILELLRSNAEPNFVERHSVDGPLTMMQSGIAQAREFDDPPGLHEKTEYLLREWVQMYHNSAGGRDTTKAFTLFVHQVNRDSSLLSGLDQNHPVLRLIVKYIDIHPCFMFIILFISQNHWLKFSSTFTFYFSNQIRLLDDFTDDCRGDLTFDGWSNNFFPPLFPLVNKFRINPLVDG